MLNLIMPYPDFGGNGYVGKTSEPVQETYLFKLPKLMLGDRNKLSPNNVIDSYPVQSSYGGGLPAGVFVKRKANGNLDYLGAEDTSANIYGISFYQLTCNTSTEGFAGIKNGSCMEVLRPSGTFTVSVLKAPGVLPTSLLGVVVESSNVDFPLGSLAVYTPESEGVEIDHKVIPLDMRKIRILSVQDEYIAEIEYNATGGFSIDPEPPTPPETDWPELTGSPTWQTISTMLGGYYYNKSAGALSFIGVLTEIDMPTKMIRQTTAIPHELRDTQLTSEKSLFTTTAVPKDESSYYVLGGWCGEWNLCTFVPANNTTNTPASFSETTTQLTINNVSEYGINESNPYYNVGTQFNYYGVWAGLEAEYDQIYAWGGKLAQNSTTVNNLTYLYGLDTLNPTSWAPIIPLNDFSINGSSYTFAFDNKAAFAADVNEDSGATDRDYIYAINCLITPNGGGTQYPARKQVVRLKSTEGAFPVLDFVAPYTAIFPNQSDDILNTSVIDDIVGGDRSPAVTIVDNFNNKYIYWLVGSTTNNTQLYAFRYVRLYIPTNVSESFPPLISYGNGVSNTALPETKRFCMANSIGMPSTTGSAVFYGGGTVDGGFNTSMQMVVEIRPGVSPSDPDIITINKTNGGVNVPIGTAIAINLNRIQ